MDVLWHAADHAAFEHKVVAAENCSRFHRDAAGKVTAEHKCEAIGQALWERDAYFMEQLEAERARHTHNVRAGYDECAFYAAALTRAVGLLRRAYDVVKGETQRQIDVGVNMTDVLCGTGELLCEIGDALADYDRSHPEKP